MEESTPAVQPVHQRQQGGHDAAVDVVLAGGAHRGQTIDLVKENDGRLVALGLVEEQAQLLFRLSQPLAQHIGTLAHVKGHSLARLDNGVFLVLKSAAQVAVRVHMQKEKKKNKLFLSLG